MIQFLQPIWLFALAGIAIPVIIHLWNEKQGKTLQVGSIRLLTSSSRQNARSLKLMDLLLLLIRCLLIMLLSLLLARPVWHKLIPPAEQKGWILMEKPHIHETYAYFKLLVDSLSKAGYEFHYFNEGFGKDNLAEVLKRKEDTVLTDRPPYWMLLGALNRQVPSALPLYLFTTNRLERFRGTRTEVSMNMTWLTFTPADSISSGPVRSYLTLADSIRLISAESRPSGYFFKSVDLSPADARSSGEMVSFEAGKLTVSMNAGAGGTPGKVEVDTSTTRLIIYEDRNSQDGRYLRAVFEALGQFSKRKLKVVHTRNTQEITGVSDWLFWLSEQPVPQNHHAKNIFCYESGKAANVRSWLRPGQNGPFEEQVAVHKLVRFDSLRPVLATGLWQDGFGNPVLGLETSRGATIYRFFSRFDPAWTDLPWSKEFPAMMLHLLEQSRVTKEIPVADQRMIDTSQANPVLTQQHHGAGARKVMVDTDLSQGLWAAAFLLFVLERVISFTKKKEKSYG